LASYVRQSTELFFTTLGINTVHTGYPYILLRFIEIKGNYVSSLYLDDPGQRSCYSDWLRAGQSGDQILVVARLSESF